MPRSHPLAEDARRASSLGLFGGSFDPPHAGHLFAADVAEQARALDHVVFVPARIPPHKLARTLAPAEHRVTLLELLLRGRPRRSIWTWELEREGPSFTIDTLRALRAALAPRARVFLIMGSDNLAGLKSWREAEALLDLAEPLVVRRSGSSFAVVDDPRVSGGLLDVDPFDASSSELRDALARGEDPGALLAPELLSYVRRHRMYGAR